MNAPGRPKRESSLGEEGAQRLEGTASTPTIQNVRVRRVGIPLNRPYWSMISTLHALDTLVAEVRLEDGGIGYGEAAIVNGYTSETLEEGWRFCRQQAAGLPGLAVRDAILRLAPHRHEQSHGVSCLVTAMEMAARHPLLEPIAAERRIPVVGGVQAHDAQGLLSEVERLISLGYRTLKMKVGGDVRTDLRNVRLAHELAQGRAILRLDANQGFTPDDACRFAAQLPPEGIELFEQGSTAGDWQAAIAIRASSTVPTMLDESIFDLSDIDRAAELGAAPLIKLKLVKCGGIEALVESLAHIRRLGMDTVLGNGVASDINNWMEACVAHAHVERTGEMNGFTRLETGLLTEPLAIEQGCLVIPAGYYPTVDADILDRYTIEAKSFG